MDDQEMQELKERLSKKREELKVMEAHTLSISHSGNDLRFLPKCQHGNKVGLCNSCNEERIEEIDKMQEWDIDREIESFTRDGKESRYHETLERKLARSGIPKKFFDRSLENFEGTEPVKKLCIEYADKFCRKVRVHGRKIIEDKGLDGYPGSMLFIGKTGCGKTHLAVSIARELIIRKTIRYDGVEFITAPELLLEIRDTFNKNSKAKASSDDGWNYKVQTENDVLDRYSCCELLVLDDLGAEKVSDFTIQSLYLVIDRRNREERPTIVTTNLSLEEIETLIDARMASRLSDMKVVRLTMPDYRKKR